MEHVKLPNNWGGCCYYDEENKIRFDPPVYEQRYSAVLGLLDLEYWTASLKKIVEFGCAEMKLFRLLRSLPAVEKILEVDIDDRLLKQCRNSVKPLLVDYVAPSPKPLTVEVWRGDISAPHECLEGTDVVIGIEIIEHLHQSVLDKVPENVFGFIRPKVAFFSTPNAEYNVLFDGLLANGFRHDDHKFEWTRAQFEEWASAICQRYPDYCVKYFGIGPAPPGSEAIGCVSQMAVFVRKDFLSGLPDPPTKTPPSSVVVVRTDEPQHGESSKTKCWFDRETLEIMAACPPQGASAGEKEEEENVAEAFSHGGDMDEGWTLEKELNLDIDNGSSDGEQEEDDGDLLDIHIPEERVRNDSGNFEEDEEAELPNGEYWLIVREDYPVAPPDERTAEQRVRDEALYQLRRLRNFGEDFFNPEQQAYLIPLYDVHNCMGTEQATMEQVRTIMTEEGYRITEEDMVCLPMEYSSDEDAVDDFAEYDLDERFEGFEEDGTKECPNRAVEGLCLAEDNATWD